MTPESSPQSIRLNKFISDSGFCSRREADKLIEDRRVRLNGQVPEMGTRVEPGDTVTVDGVVIGNSAADKSDRVYIAYNKPIGITCTTERQVKGNIVDAIDHEQRIFPIGRLDKPSEGLILLTSDGDIVNKILRAENAHEKEYVVGVNKPLAADFAGRMSSGIPILGTVTKPCRVTVTGKTSFRIVLTQGLNRQIRRMCEYLGYEVTSLKRIRIMNIELGRLRPGQWRNLTSEEMGRLNNAVADSHKDSQQVHSPHSGDHKPAERKKSKHSLAERDRRSRAANKGKGATSPDRGKSGKPKRTGAGSTKRRPQKSSKPRG